MGFFDAWDGYRRFVLGVDPAAAPVSRAEAVALDHALGRWQATGIWQEDAHD